MLFLHLILVNFGTVIVQIRQVSLPPKNMEAPIEHHFYKNNMKR